MPGMKTSLIVIILIVMGMLGLLVVYSQTGLPDKAEDVHVTAAAYGAGAVTRAVDYTTMAIIIAIFLAILLSDPISKAFRRKK